MLVFKTGRTNHLSTYPKSKACAITLACRVLYTDGAQFALRKAKTAVMSI
jgi:hypothetical protein